MSIRSSTNAQQFKSTAGKLFLFPACLALGIVPSWAIVWQFVWVLTLGNETLWLRIKYSAQTDGQKWGKLNVGKSDERVWVSHGDSACGSPVGRSRRRVVGADCGGWMWERRDGLIYLIRSDAFFCHCPLTSNQGFIFTGPMLSESKLATLSDQ